MALHDPSWRIKTRPCPFFQQGRCLFAESCNFLHTNDNAIQNNYLNTPEQPQHGLRVIVNSPESTRSPPRSPRMASLLFALRDVIGDPDDEDTMGSGSQATGWSESLPTLVNKEGFGFTSSPPVFQDEEEDDDLESEGHWTAISDYDDELPVDDATATVAYEVGGQEEEDEEEVVANTSSEEAAVAQIMNRQSVASMGSSTSSGLLSPMELSTLNLGPFRNFSLREDNSASSFDSGYADTWKPPVPLMSSPPRSPSIASTFDLLASPYGVAASQRLSASPHRSPLLNSPLLGGAARSPTVMAAPEVAEPPPDLGLDSPSEYHRNKVIEELTAKFARENPPVEPVDDDTDVMDVMMQEQESYGHTSIWDAQTGDTAVFVGGSRTSLALGDGDAEAHEDDLRRSSRTPTHLVETPDFWEGQEFAAEQAPLAEVQDELRRLSKTPTHFLAEEPNFQVQEAVANSSAFADDADADADHSSSFADDSDTDAYTDAGPNAHAYPVPQPEYVEGKSAWSDDDTTACLAYLVSPTVQQQQQPSVAPESNDTLTSLYDAYSVACGALDETPVGASQSFEPFETYEPFESSEPSPARSFALARTPAHAPTPLSLGRSPITRSPISRSPITESPISPSPASTTPSSLRERVFTPPPPSSSSHHSYSRPTRKRSGTITGTADSPNSISSPITSLDSVSRGRASPFSERAQSQPQEFQSRSSSKAPASGRQSPFVQEVEVGSSKKVPFGFRSSFALGPSSKSSLMSNRQLTKSIPPSPLQNEAELSPLASPTSLPSASRPIPKGLKPLRLSTLFDAKYNSRSSSLASPSSSQSATGFQVPGISNRASMSAASVSSSNSLTNNPLLSSSRPPVTTSAIDHNLIPSTSEPHAFSPRSLHHHLYKSISNISNGPRSAPVAAWRASVAINYSRPSSRLSEPIHEAHDEDEFSFSDHYDDDDEDDTGTGTFSRRLYDEPIRRPVSTTPYSAPLAPTAAMRQPPPTYIETPKPTLMFAIASDDAEQVRQVLASGGRDGDPNDTAMGPQSALEFALTSEGLVNKLEIVKTLLAYGADPASVKQLEAPASSSASATGESAREAEGEDADVTAKALPEQAATPAAKQLMDAVDPATRYYIERADAIHTKRMSVLINRSFFRPLTRVRYDLIGQDRALEQLFRVLSIHSRDLAASPMVVMLCGPSGHGKSLLARKFGSLLEVPTHTVNMTTLRSTLDLWNSHSMSPYETPTTCTLAEFLTNNEGKRCVVVLDEIEKTEDPKTLWSLLMPWELGRCAFETGKRHVDVKNVIWLGTSNIGHDLVFQHHAQRKSPEDLMSREEFVELMGLLRPMVSERLGASILSRITTVLPFVPFTMEEKRAICSEALYNLGGETTRAMSPDEVGRAIDAGLAGYVANEGARSLHRAVSNYLVDVI